MDDETACGDPNCEECGPAPEPRLLHWTDPIRWGFDLVGRVSLAVSDQCGQTARDLRNHAAVVAENRDELTYSLRAMAELDLIQTRETP